MKRNVSVTFYLKKDKKNSKGLCPIYAKIMFEATPTATIATGCWISDEDWSSSGKLTKARKPHQQELSRSLAAIRQRIYDEVNRLSVLNFPISSKILAQTINPPKSKSNQNVDSRTLLNEFDTFIKEKVALAEKLRRSPATCTKYYSTQKHVKNFIKKNYGKEDVELTSLDYEFVNHFYQYLVCVANIGNNTAQKYIQFLRSTIYNTIKNGHLEKDPFIKWKYEWDEVETVYLTNDELKAIESKQFKNKRLDVIRDIFLFTVYTGLAPIDLQKITPSNVQKLNDGRKWLVVNRQKTKIASNVMVLPQVEKLIYKYKTDKFCIANGKLLPYRANQTMNEYLKEIADLCGINKRLTHYVGRHTFATTIMLQNGVSMDVVSEALGHKRLVQTQHYAKITEIKRSVEFSKLYNKFK